MSEGVLTTQTQPAQNESDDLANVKINSFSCLNIKCWSFRNFCIIQFIQLPTLACISKNRSSASRPLMQWRNSVFFFLLYDQFIPFKQNIASFMTRCLPAIYFSDCVFPFLFFYSFSNVKKVVKKKKIREEVAMEKTILVFIE